MKNNGGDNNKLKACFLSGKTKLTNRLPDSSRKKQEDSN